jgi:hypothetical protein
MCYVVDRDATHACVAALDEMWGAPQPKGAAENCCLLAPSAPSNHLSMGLKQALHGTSRHLSLGQVMVQVTCPKSLTCPKTHHYLSHPLVPEHGTCPTHLSQSTTLVPPTCPTAFLTCHTTSLTCPTTSFGGNCIKLDWATVGAASTWPAWTW